MSIEEGFGVERTTWCEVVWSAGKNTHHGREGQKTEKDKRHGLQNLQREGHAEKSNMTGRGVREGGTERGKDERAPYEAVDRKYHEERYWNGLGWVAHYEWGMLTPRIRMAEEKEDASDLDRR
jgi:hypothetical protein